MDQKRVIRKLRAILSADVQGYSRLMGDDEVSTVKTITEYRKIFSSIVTQHNGRVVDSPGDNILSEFASVVDAVQCAVEIQRVLKAKNEELPENRRMVFRIGVNLGDVIQEGDRIYGDGVNIAARIESLAEGGGICISGTAYDHIKNKLALGYNYLGEHSVKNISEPVRVYKVPMDPKDVVKKKSGKSWKKMAIAALIFMLLAGAAAFWIFYPSRAPISKEAISKETPTPTESSEKATPLPLPDKPSIAVLPFVNISGDPNEDYLSDGITDQIITALSKTPKMFVIARNSVLTYKGKPVKVQQVSKELGVRYVLEGSVQKSGDRLRITAQLIDATTGNHVWGESFDRDLKDIFVLQDDITRNVIMALQVNLTDGEVARTFGRGTDNLEAYLKVQKGIYHVFRWNKNDNEIAQKYFNEAIALDPEYSNAYTLLAWPYIHEISFGWTKTPEKSREKAIELANHAISLDDANANPHMVLASLYSGMGQFEKALNEAKKGFSLEPDNAEVIFIYGDTLSWSGSFQEAVEKIEKALLLDPINPNSNNSLANAYFALGQYERAIEASKKQIKTGNIFLNSYLTMAASYFLLGNKEEAQKAIEQILKTNPEFSLELFAKFWLNKPLHPKVRKVLEIRYEALRKAGLK